MKKTNNKGFLLAETLITVCIISALATSMYIYISKTTSRFEERDNYERVVDVYKLNTIREYAYDYGCLTESKVNSLNSFNSCMSGILSNNIKQKLNLKYLLITSAQKDGLNGLLNRAKTLRIIEENVKSFENYIDYIPIDDSQISDTEYRLIGMFQEGSNTPTFANIIINVNE